MNPRLFSNGHLRDSLEGQSRRLADAVSSVPEEHLLQADVEAWVAALVDEFLVECPTLDLDTVYRDPVQEVNRRIPGYRVAIHIPYTGDRAVFELRPNSFTHNPPSGAIGSDELVLTLEYSHDTTPDIGAEANAFVGKLQQWLGFAPLSAGPIHVHRGSRPVPLERAAKEPQLLRRPTL